MHEPHRLDPCDNMRDARRHCDCAGQLPLYLFGTSTRQQVASRFVIGRQRAAATPRIVGIFARCDCEIIGEATAACLSLVCLAVTIAAIALIAAIATAICALSVVLWLGP